MPDESDLDAYFAARSTDPVAEHLTPERVRTLGNRRHARRMARNWVALVAVVAIGGVAVTNLTHGVSAIPAAPVSASTSASPSTAATTVQATPTPAPSNLQTSSPAATTASAATSTTVNPVVRAGDVLTTTGIGELTLGMSTSTLTSRGVLVGTPGNCSVDETPTLTAEGIAIYTMSGRVTGIHLTTTRHGTKSGIAIGATVADVLSTYSSNVAVKTSSYGSTSPKNVDLLVVSSGGHDLVFVTQNLTTDPTDTVRRIVLTYSGYQVLDAFC